MNAVPVLCISLFQLNINSSVNSAYIQEEAGKLKPAPRDQVLFINSNFKNMKELIYPHFWLFNMSLT